MIKVAYMLVALAALAPAALIAATCLYVLSQVEFGPETDRASGETMQFTTLSVKQWGITIHPRRWAAAVVLFASVLWFVGVVFLLFVRTY
jgi:hypothetical protein